MVFEPIPNYKPFYIVDTITINDPVSFSSDLGGATCFYTSKQNLLDNYEYGSKFLLSPNVFIEGELVGSIGTEYECRDVWKSQKRIDINLKGITGTSELSPKFNKFLLTLVRADYYNINYSSTAGYFRIPAKYEKYYYIKVVNPICVDDWINQNPDKE